MVAGAITQNLLSIASSNQPFTDNKAKMIPTTETLRQELSNTHNAIDNYLSKGVNSSVDNASLQKTLQRTHGVIQQFLDRQSANKNNPNQFMAQSSPVQKEVKNALNSMLFHALKDLESKRLMQNLDALLKLMMLAALHQSAQSSGAFAAPPPKNMGVEGLDESVNLRGMLKDFKNFAVNGKTADGKKVKIRVSEKDVKKYGSMEAALEQKMKKAGISDLSELKDVKLKGKRTDGLQTRWMKPQDLNDISSGKKKWKDVKQKKRGFFARIGSFFKGIGKGIAKIGKGIWNGIKGIGKGIWNGIKSVGKAVVNVVKGVGKTIVGAIKTGGAFLGKLFKGDLKGAGNVLKEGGKKIWNTVKDTAIRVKDGVVNLGKGAWNILKSVGQGVGNLYKGIGEGFGKLLKGDIGGAFNSVLDGMKNQWSTMSNGFKTGLGQMVDGTASIVSSPVSLVAGKEAGDSVGNVVKKTGNFGAGFVTGAVDGMAKVTGGTANIANGRGSIEDNVSDIVTGGFDVATSVTGAGGAIKGVKGLSNLGKAGKAGMASQKAGKGFTSGARERIRVIDDKVLAKKQANQGKAGELKDRYVPGANKSHTTQNLVSNESTKLIWNVNNTSAEREQNNPQTSAPVQWA